MKFETRTVELKNGVTMMLQEAQPEDAEELMQYIAQVGGETDNLMVDENGLGFTLEQEQNFLRSCCERDDSIMLTGRIDGKIISTSQVSRTSPRARSRHVGVLSITIAKRYWGQGAGTAVMETLFAFARSLGIEVVELDVRADNDRAVALYKKMGFETTGTHRKAMKFKDGSYQDTYLMQAFLNT